MASRQYLVVKVAASSRQDTIVGLAGGALKVKVSAPAQRGKANEAVVRLLADRLGVERSRISIVRGHGVPVKQVRVSGLDADQVLQMLGLS